jgi:hypothetical protein
MMLTHPSGFSVRYATNGWTHHQITDGYTFDPNQTANSRRSSTITITAATPPLTNQQTLTNSKTLTTRTARYELVDQDGGSGGTETTLTAEIICTQTIIRLTQTLQVEAPQQPDFTDAWALLDSVSCVTAAAKPASSAIKPAQIR